MSDTLDNLLSNFELPPSEEIAFLDEAIEASKDIQNLIKESSLQLERLSATSCQNYDYNLMPSLQLSEGCTKAELAIFSLYDAQLSSKICEKIVRSASSKSSLSASSKGDQNLTATAMFGYRTRKEFNKIYSRAMTEKIKCEREIEAVLLSLRKISNLSTERARKANYYNWFQERPRKVWKEKKFVVKKTTSMCRVSVLKKIVMKRPLSTIL